MGEEEDDGEEFLFRYTKYFFYRGGFVLTFLLIFFSSKMMYGEEGEEREEFLFRYTKNKKKCEKKMYSRRRKKKYPLSLPLSPSVFTVLFFTNI